MELARCLRLTAARQLFLSVFPDGLQHREPRVGRFRVRRDRCSAQQTLVDQGSEEIERGGQRQTSTGFSPASLAAHHRLRGLKREAPGEDGEPPKARLFLVAQQGVGPADGVPHRPLAGRQVAPAADQQRQPWLQPS